MPPIPWCCVLFSAIGKSWILHQWLMQITVLAYQMQWFCISCIVHARVRVNSILCFSLPCTFTMFAELESYFMYWRVLINQHGVQVGHPLGNLQYVFYHNYNGLEHCSWHKLLQNGWPLWNKGLVLRFYTLSRICGNGRHYINGRIKVNVTSLSLPTPLYPML